jgi:hypothetical protein
LKRIESRACYRYHLSIVIPSTVVFVAYDAHPDLCQLSLSDPDSCPMFYRWRRLGFASCLPCFEDFVLDPSGFEEITVIGRNKGVSTQIYQRRIDGAMTVAKTISLSGSIERRQIETEI